MTKSKTKTADGIRVYCSHDKILNIDELKPNPKNPNQHPDEQIELLSKIILQNGWRDRITVSNLSGMIVKGHGRYMAAIGAGLGEVPVDYQDYEDAAAEYADLIADNKIAELSEVDDEAARALIESLDSDDFDFELAGFTTKELNFLIRDDEGGENKHNEKKPEIEFTQELLESSNYIILVFNNTVDWLQAESVFNLKTVKALHSKEGFKCQGVGRVVDGPEAIERLRDV
jgi:hypothetical protein